MLLHSDEHLLSEVLGSPVCVFKVNTLLCSLPAGLVDCAIDVHASHCFFFHKGTQLGAGKAAC